MHTQPNNAIAIVSGASGGIGAAVAAELARRGYRLVLMGRDLRKLENVRAAVAAGGGLIERVMAVDFADADAVADAAAQLAAHSPQVLVNNAGYGVFVPFLELSMSEHQRMIQVNYLAAAALIHAVLPGMVRRRGGCIINVASIAAKIGPWGHSAYAAGKSAMLTLTYALDAEYRSQGVRCSCLHPGIVDTPFFAGHGYEKLAGKIAKFRVPPQRVARAVGRLLDHPRVETYCPWHYRIVALLNELCPPLVRRVIARSGAAE
jgi:short-subunit dehydrogenase